METTNSKNMSGVKGSNNFDQNDFNAHNIIIIIIMLCEFYYDFISNIEETVNLFVRYFNFAKRNLESKINYRTLVSKHDISPPFIFSILNIS